MNRFDKLALPIALGCTLGSVGIAGLALLVITLSSLDPTAQLPFFYFQKLNFAAVSVLLPVVGVVALLPIVLRYAFGQAEAEAVKPVVEPIVESAPQPTLVLEDQHLKAA